MGADKDFDTFPKHIDLKVNVITQLEFKLTYYNVAVQHVCHYAMVTPLYRIGILEINCV